MRKVNLSLHLSAMLVIQEVVIFWQRARIHIKVEYNCIKKLELLYKE